MLVGASGLVGRAVIDRGGRTRRRAPDRAGAARVRRCRAGARMELLVADPGEWPSLIANAQRRRAGHRARHDLARGGRGRGGVPRGRREAGAGLRRRGEGGGGAALHRGVVGRGRCGRAQLLPAREGRGREPLWRNWISTGSTSCGPACCAARATERRPAEKLAMLASPLTDPLLHGGLRRYRSVSARDRGRRDPRADVTERRKGASSTNTMRSSRAAGRD